MPQIAIRITSFLPWLALVAFSDFLLAQSVAVRNESDTDRRALLCLKSQLHDPSQILESWRDDLSTFCEWHGVTCGKRHTSRVVALDLESQNITGQIFPCVAALTFLTRLHMPNNQLNGQISPNISGLARLRYLNLSVNSISGEIPQTISSCSRLEIVAMYSNSLQGTIPSSLAQCSHLRSIVLSNNNLQGSIPTSLALLSNLSVLFLPSNQLTGSIPGFLGSGRYLRWVSLQNNNLSGGMPTALFNSTTLYYIDLSYNGLSGSIPPLSQASSSPLQYLSLTENNISGEIPQSLGNLTSISLLLLAGNNLHGSIPESLGKLTTLQVLDLSYNNLSGIVTPALYNISTLTFLGLSANHLVGKIPTDIGHNLPSIENFLLAMNQFEGQIPASLANASNMQFIDLRRNTFTGVIPALGSLTELTHLDFGVNRLEAGDWSFLSSLTNCTKLQELWLDTNSLQGKIFSYLTKLSKTLEVLVLIENKLTGAMPSEMGNFVNLTVLEMDKNLLSGHIPDTLGNLQNLSILGLSQNKLSGEIPHSIGKLKRLTELYLQQNVLTGLIPASLDGCRSLLNLNISYNRLHGTIPQELFSISTLSEGLDMSYNQITGDIPLQIGKLISLNSLNLSNNKLSGEIPVTLGQCTLLESLQLEENLLYGSIPNSFTSLRGMTRMDLSRNNLSGRIPIFFETFSYLQILNLSFNDLEGPVPGAGLFTNSSAVFIQGNNKLCATSPILQVPLCRASPSKRKKGSYNIAVVVPLSIVIAISLACAAAILLNKRKEPKRFINQTWKQFKNFSYEDLFEATDGFSPNSLVGSGSYGLVYKAQFNYDVCTVAIKLFKPDQLGSLRNFVSECEALRNIRHRNLIRVISVCSTIDPTGNEFKALILEYMSNGNLESWLHPNEYGQNTRCPLSLGSRITIAVDIAAALDYLHNRCVPPLVHRDVKPSNVLLNNEMVACLSDFGLAKFLSSDTSVGLNDSSSIVGARGSVGYIAPEYGMGCKSSIEGDVYSYGIILLEMVTGRRPTEEMFKDDVNLRNFVESSLPQQINEILEPDLYGSHEGVDIDQIMAGIRACALQLAYLGLNCSEMSPKDRPSTEEAYAEILAIKEEFSAVCNWGS